jgi:uncharacterized protein YbjT (DUF2867 family)
MILVAGGTGTLGRDVVRRLSSAGREVRVLTREATRAAGLPREVEVVVGDVRSRSDVERAVRGATVVVSAIQGFAGEGRPSPETIDREGNLALIAAAKTARVDRFVLLSAYDARADHPMSLHRAKHAAEAALRESGLRFGIVRPTAFLETWIGVIGGPLTRGEALVFGPGKNPVNFVSIRDVAAVVARLAGDPAGPDEVVDLAGPENLGFAAFADRLIAARGQPAKIKRIPLGALRVMAVLARPFSPVFARQAHAAVVMNTIDMSTPPSPAATTRLADVL